MKDWVEPFLRGDCVMGAIIAAVLLGIPGLLGLAFDGMSGSFEGFLGGLYGFRPERRRPWVSYALLAAGSACLVRAVLSVASRVSVTFS